MATGSWITLTRPLRKWPGILAEMETLRTVEGNSLLAHLPFDPSTGLRTSSAQGKAEDRLLILVNGRSIHLLQGLDTPLADGDRVTIMPKAFGG